MDDAAEGGGSSSPPGRRGRGPDTEPDSTERGLRIAIIVIAVGITITAGYMIYQAIAQREAPPRTYYEFELRRWQNVVNQNPESPVGYENLGFIYYKMERYSQAINTFNRALDLDPDRVMAKINLGRTYRELGDSELAIKYLEEGADFTTPTNKAGPFYDIGKIYEDDLENIEKAVEFYLKSIQDDPNIWDSRMALGAIYEDREEFARALVEYRSALDLDPSLVEVNDKVREVVSAVAAEAKTAADSGDNETAIRLYGLAVDGGIPGELAEVMLALGALQFQNGDDNDALSTLLAAAEDGGDPGADVMKQIHETLTDVYSALGNSSKATEHSGLAAAL